MYGCMNDFLDLGLDKPLLERDFIPLTRAELSVWTAEHPAPSGNQLGESHERALLANWTLDAQKQIAQLREDPVAYDKIVGGAWEVMLGESQEKIVEVEWNKVRETAMGNYRSEWVLLNEPANGRQLPALVIYPASNSASQVILWLTDTGKGGLLTERGEPKRGVKKLLDAGCTIVGLDLLYQGEFLSTDEKLTRTRLNNIYPNKAEDKRQGWEYYAAYTFGYNLPLFSKRVHDVMAAVRALRAGALQTNSLALVGQGKEGGALAMASSFVLGNRIEKTVALTGGFRFASVTRFDDPMFVPGAVKYDDVAGLARLVGDRLLWLDAQETVPMEEKFTSWLLQ